MKPDDIVRIKVLLDIVMTGKNELIIFASCLSSRADFATDFALTIMID